MTAEASAASWAALAADVPELAASMRVRFESNLHHVLGSLRKSGAPRLSGTEVYFDDEEGIVWLGMMPGSRKLVDVRRDPRVEVHSAPVEEDLRAGDAKLAGRLVAMGPIDDAAGAGYFELRVERASLVRVENNELVITSWQTERGTSEHRRT